MFCYGKDGSTAIVSRQQLSSLDEITPDEACELPEVVYAVSMERGKSRAMWKGDRFSLDAGYVEILDSVLFYQTEALDNGSINAKLRAEDVGISPEWLLRMCDSGHLTVMNMDYPDVMNRQPFRPGVGKKVNIAGLGDVGGTLAIGLRLLGGDCLREIGIYGGGNAQAEQRWNYELNQILDATDPDNMPPVRIIGENELFDCDIFAFCASAGVPPLGSELKDVRLVQYEANAAIIEKYALLARLAKFQGIFAVVSDPVDLLCAKVFSASNRDGAGMPDFLGLLPEQIRGYGLGVMYARAAYYAGLHGCRAEYIASGRAFGPHGEGLIIANSLDDFNADLSDLLASLTVQANIAVRATGFKPYIAPALSSGALSLLGTVRGDWHYCSTFIAGTFLGARNRITQHGIEVERIKAPWQLKQKIEETYSLVKEMSEKCCEL